MEIKMNELSKVKTMTVKEVAEILKVSERTIQRHAESLGLTRNGFPTYLIEEHVTIIKLRIERSGRNDLDNVVELPKTKLEKAMLIQQAMTFQQEIIEEQQKEIETLKPKAIEYDKFMSAENLKDVGEVARYFGIGRNTFFKQLRESKIFKSDNTPYQEYMHHFEVKVKPVSKGCIIENESVTFFRPSGISYVAKRFNLVEVN